MEPEISKVTEPVILGEGPHWDSGRKVLFFVSILDQTINKYVPATGEHVSTKLDGRVGFMVPVEGTADQFVVGLERKFVLVQWDGGDGSKAKVIRELAEVDPGTINRLNDGKADPRGRLFGGTMGHEEPIGNYELNKGSLYRLDGASITKMADKISIANGLAWDIKAKAFYYIDSPERKIRRYDYDIETGNISNQKYIFDFDTHGIDGLPDGMTIDTDGNLWVAVFNGSCILHVNPKTGKLLRKIPIPAKQVTSVTFGGDNLDILFVTSACIKVGDEEQKPPCGAIFMITGLGVKGYPNINFKL